MKRLLLILLVLIGLLLTGCSNCDKEIQRLGPPIAKARAAAIVWQTDIVVGTTVTPEMVEWAKLNVDHWNELWQLVKFDPEAEESK